MTPNAAKCFAYPVVAAFACLAPFVRCGSHVAIIQHQKTQLAPKPATFGPFVIDGVEYTVRMQNAFVMPSNSREIKPQTESPEETVAYASVQDAEGNKVWERKFDGDDFATETTTAATAYEVQGQTGKSIIIEYGKISPKRLTSGAFTLLAPRNGRLQVIAPEVKFYGRLEHIPDAGPDRRHLVAGDIIRYEFWTGNYHLLRGVRVDLTAGTITRLCSQKCSFSIMNDANPIERNVTVQLFDAPSGKPRRLVVPEQSSIEFLDAYVEDVTTLDAAGPKRQRPWLNVHIDGASGWISDPADLEKLGLLPMERSDGS